MARLASCEPPAPAASGSAAPLPPHSLSPPPPPAPLCSALRAVLVGSLFLAAKMESAGSYPSPSKFAALMWPHASAAAHRSGAPIVVAAEAALLRALAPSWRALAMPTPLFWAAARLAEVEAEADRALDEKADGAMACARAACAFFVDVSALLLPQLLPPGRDGGSGLGACELLGEAAVGLALEYAAAAGDGRAMRAARGRQARMLAGMPGSGVMRDALVQGGRRLACLMAAGALPALPRREALPDATMLCAQLHRLKLSNGRIA